MIDFSDARLKSLVVHKVGNKMKEESLGLSKGLTDIYNKETEKLLLKYFLSSFNHNEFYNLAHASDITLNEVYTYSRSIFDNNANFYIQSIAIARHLFEKSVHPKIKTGELYVCLLDNCRIQNKTMNALGIFKSENKESFLKVSHAKEIFNIDFDNGININKLDKGCIIFNTDEEAGFRVCIVDKINKGEEAQYWKDSFLHVKPCADDYHHTHNYLNLTKTFVMDHLKEEQNVSKTEKIDILNRSMAYFKNKEQFDEKEFTEEVFENKEVFSSFSKYKENFQTEQEMNIQDDFPISAQAVKTQARVFKSVLKLDKNFHIYIHGNKEMIEKGIDENGRKYYKLFYNEEA